MWLVGCGNGSIPAANVSRRYRVRTAETAYRPTCVRAECRRGLVLKHWQRYTAFLTKLSTSLARTCETRRPRIDPAPTLFKRTQDVSKCGTLKRRPTVNSYLEENGRFFISLFNPVKHIDKYYVPPAVTISNFHFVRLLYWRVAMVLTVNGSYFTTRH